MGRGSVTSTFVYESYIRLRIIDTIRLTVHKTTTIRIHPESQIVSTIRDHFSLCSIQQDGNTCLNLLQPSLRDAVLRGSFVSSRTPRISFSTGQSATCVLMHLLVHRKLDPLLPCGNVGVPGDVRKRPGYCCASHQARRGPGTQQHPEPVDILMSFPLLLCVH